MPYFLKQTKKKHNKTPKQEQQQQQKQGVLYKKIFVGQIYQI